MPPQNPQQPDPAPTPEGADGKGTPGKQKPQRSTGQKVVRWLFIGVGSVVGLVVALVLILLIVLQTNWGAARIGDALVGLANPFDDAQIEVGNIEGNWISSLRLYDVNITRTDTLNADFAAADTVRMLHADTLDLRYRLWSLLRGKIHVRDAYVAGLDVKMQQQADSTWDLLRFAGQDTTTKAVDTTGSAFTFEVEHIRLRRANLAARFYPPERDSTLRIANLNAQVDSLLIDDQIALDLNTLIAEVTPPASDETMDVYAQADLRDGVLAVDSLRLDSPSTSLTAIGTLALPTDLHDEFHDIDFRLDAEPLAFRDIAPFVPMLDPTGSATMHVRVQGTSHRLEATAQGGFSDGATLDLTATITPATADSLTYQVDGELRGINPAFFTGNPTMAGRINADVKADLRGTALESLNGTARVLLSDSRYSEYAFDRSVLDVTFDDGEARIDLNTGLRGAGLALNGTATPFAETPTYDLRGSLRSFDLGQFSEGGTQSSDITTTFRLRGTGFDPQTADLTATLDFAPSRVNNYHINEGTLTARMNEGDLTFNTRLKFPEGLVAARGDATIGEQIRYRISEGRFENLDVAALTGDTTRSALTGTFSLRGSGTDPATDLHLSEVRLDLRDSFYGTYQVNNATVTGNLASGRLNLNADANLDGGSFDVRGHLRPFDTVPSFSITDGIFNNVDIGRLTQNPNQQSNLNGRILQLDGRGFDPATMTLDTRLELTDSQYNDQIINSATAMASLQQGGLTFDAVLDTPEGRTNLAGTADLFGEELTFALNKGTLNGLNLGALLHIPNLQTSLNGTINQFEVRGTDPKTMTLLADLELTRSTINDATVLDGTLQATLLDGDADAQAVLNLEQGSVRLDTLTANLASDRPTFQAVGRIDSVNVASLAGIDTMQVDVSADFGFEGAGFDPATMDMQGRLRSTYARYDSVRVNELDTRFRLNQGLLNVDTLYAHTNVANVQAGGPIALFDSLGTYTSDFRLQADSIDAAPLRPLIDAEVFALNNGAINARIFGKRDSLRVESTVSLNSLVYNETRVAGLDVRAEGSLGPDWMPQQGTLTTEVNYFSNPALLVRYSEFDLAYADSTVDFDANLTIDHRRDTQLRGQVDIRPDNRRIIIDELALHFDDDRWKLLQQASISYGDEYRVSNLLLFEDDQQIAMDGVIDLDGNQSLILTIEQFQTATVADLFGFRGLGGILNGSLDLTGPSTAPVLAGQLNFDVESFDESVGDLQLDVRYDSLRLNLDATLTHEDSSTLSLEGYIPMDLRLSQGPGNTANRQVLQVTREEADPSSTVALQLNANAFNIGWIEPFLDPETYEEIEGKLTAQVDVTGTLDAPELSGEGTLTQGRLGLDLLGLSYTNINAEAELVDNQIRVNHATMKSGDGEVIAHGTIDLAKLTLGEFDIQASAEDFKAIDSDQYSAVVSADVELKGTTRAPVLNGTVNLQSADIYLTNETTAAQFEPVTLTEADLLMLERNFGVRVTEADTSTFVFYDALAMNMTVTMDRDVWLRSRGNPDMNIQFTGSLDLQKQPYQDQQLFGTIDVIEERSYINQFGRRFNIRKGILIFNGPANDPRLDIEAAYAVRSRGSQEAEITITLNVTGRLDNLDIELGSDPQTDYTNIVSYIATGRPADKAFQLGGVKDIGTGLALSQLANIVEGAAGEGLGLDVIEIQQDGLQGATITAGKYLSPRLYAAVSWPISLNNTNRDNTNINTTNTQQVITLEYELYNWLLARLIARQTRAIQFNLLYEYSY